ncbi:WD40 repeat domain-containing serine/threonine protein kinase, partial [Singulisphaera acidiphila]
MNDSELEDDPLGGLADEFLERYRRGERPALSEYMRRFPDLAERIEDLFPALVMLEEVRSGAESPPSALEPIREGKPLAQLGEYRIVRRIGRGGMGIVYEAEQESLGRRVALKVLPPESHRNPHQIERFRREARAAAQLHHTNIVPVFGVGQDGETLYYVMQYIEGSPLDAVLDELRQIRSEAKVEAATHSSSKSAAEPQNSDGKRRRSPLPTPPHASTDVARSLWEGRFRSGSGRKEGSEPSLSPLDQGDAVRADANLALLSPNPAVGSSPSALGANSSSASLSDPRMPYAWSVAHIGVQVADALEHADGQGILHRDIKPSNLLLDLSGTVWLTDFGLAKTSGSADLTHTGDLLGTLRYLAPERFQGRTDVRGDIYALGLTLYELLVLRPAFADHGEERLILQITSGDPPRLDVVDPDLPRDLVTIVHKAIAKDPCDRYQTPGALAEDLRRFLEDRPIVARQAGAVERSWRWCRRNPGLAVSAGSTAIALMTAALLALLYANSQARATAKITGLAHQISHSLNESNHRLAVLDLERGQVACERGEIDRGLLLMVESLRAATAVNDSALRHAARANLSAWSRYLPRLTGAFSHGGLVTQVAFSPDGTKFATGCSDGKARFWDVATGQLTDISLAHQAAVRTLLFSPDGKTILTRSQDGAARLWDVATGQPVGPALAQYGFVEAVAFSPDGKFLLTGSEDNTSRLWNLATGRLASPPLPHPKVVRALAFSPDGKTALTGSQEGVARLWEVATGELAGPLLHHQGPIDVVAFSPDGRLVLTAGQDNTARLWEAATGKPIGSPLRHQNWVEAAAFSPDGKTVLTGSQDSTARLWDARSSDPICLPLLHQGPVRTVAFSPDGKTALTGSGDGSARL